VSGSEAFWTHGGHCRCSVSFPSRQEWCCAEHMVVTLTHAARGSRVNKFDENRLISDLRGNLVDSVGSDFWSISTEFDQFLQNSDLVASHFLFHADLLNTAGASVPGRTAHHLVRWSAVQVVLQREVFRTGLRPSILLQGSQVPAQIILLKALNFFNSYKQYNLVPVAAVKINLGHLSNVVRTQKRMQQPVE
jgi:hypothetical protein